MSRAPDAGDGWTAEELRRALWRHFAGRYAVLVEVPARDPAAQRRYEEWHAGLRAYHQGHALERPTYVLEPGHRRVDVLLWAPSDRIAVEVKVSRSDFAADVADPDKQRVWRELAHRHAYACPAGLVDKAEVPADSGLIVATRHNSGVAWAKRAPMRRNVPEELPERVLSTLLHRCAWAEAHAKGLHTELETEHDPGHLRAERDRLERRCEVLGNENDRLRGRAEHYRRLASAGPGWPCASCGEALSATWSSRAGERWRHRGGPAADAACEAYRAGEVARRKAAGERYVWDSGPRPAELLEELST